MRIRVALLISVAAIGCSAPGHAQDAEAVSEPEAATSGTTVYDQTYFAAYDVQNAQDMLRRIPGVNSILASQGRGGQQRGFGSGGGDQILVNGRRFPGKSNDISRTLTSLRATSVDRVEVIRGGSADIDVQSTGVIVNIVLAEGASLAGGGTFEIAARGNDEGAFGVDGLATYAGSTGNLGYNVGVDRSIWAVDFMGGRGGAGWTNRFRDEVYLYPDGLIQELRPRFSNRDYNKWTLTGGLTYDLAGGARAQLNGLYETADSIEFNRIDVTRFDRQGVETLAIIEEQTRDSGPTTVMELGGEFTTSLWGGGLTLLLLGNSRKQPTLDDRISIDGDEVRELSRSDTMVKRTEYIGRVQYNFPLSSEIGLNVGGEASNNKLQQDLKSFSDLDDDGTVEPVVIPTGNALVEEVRGEVFTEARWSPTAAVSATGSLTYEHSKLTTNSIFNAGRTLGFLKPRLDVRYSLSSAGVLRLLAEKQVSQLEFGNFVPSYNLRDDRIDAGNPGLLPEKVWNFELGYEHRLPNDLGVIGGHFFYRDITDAIDFIPLRQGLILVSAQGNLGDATNYGAEVNASVRLAPINLRDAVVTFSAELEESSVIDPFTGEERRLGRDPTYGFSIGFRHDVRAINLSYGVEYANRGLNRIRSDLFARDFYRPGPALSAFAEKRLTSSLVLRGEAQNLLGANEYRRREIYAVDQFDGVIRRLDRSSETRDLRYAIILKGTF